MHQSRMKGQFLRLNLIENRQGELFCISSNLNKVDKKKILIVEDEKGMMEALKESFEKAGFDVFTAQDGERAIEVTRKTTPDVILLDIILPRKNGFEVLKEWKSDKDTKEVPVVLCTNLSDMKDIQKAIDLGAKTYLLKSDYSLAAIVEKIREVLKDK